MLAAAFDALTDLNSVIAPPRRRFELFRLNGHLALLRRLHRNSSLPPVGTRDALSRSRKMRLPLTPHVTPTDEVIRFGGGGGGAGVTSTDRAALDTLPTPSVAFTMTVKAPAEPNAWVTAPPVAVPPSPKFQFSETGDQRSVAAAAMPTP